MGSHGQFHLLEIHRQKRITTTAIACSFESERGDLVAAMLANFRFSQGIFKKVRPNFWFLFKAVNL